MPKLYLKCEECGEVFDDIAIAHTHNDDPTSSWSIVTEDEAF